MRQTVKKRMQAACKHRAFMAAIAEKKNVVVKIVRATDRKTALVIFESGRPSRSMDINDWLNTYFDADSTDTLYAYATLRTPGLMPDSEIEIDELLEGEAW